VTSEREATQARLQELEEVHAQTLVSARQARMQGEGGLGGRARGEGMGVRSVKMG
jgi:hypothetical protein